MNAVTTSALLPFAGKLQGALADGFAEGLVRRKGGEPFGLGLALVTQEVNQTQCLTLRSQLRRPRSCVPHLHRPVVASRHQPLSVRAKRHAADVSFQRERLLTACDVPQLHRLIGAS